MPTPPSVLGDQFIPDGPDNPEGEMTSQQATVLRALCEKHNEPFDATLSQQQADERIAYLKDTYGDA